jgi:hypothetical protein
VEDQHAAVDERDRVWRALGRLPRRQRAVLVLRFFEDLPESEVADILGISLGTVKSQAAKALAKLRLDESLLPEPTMPPTPAERLANVEKKITQRRRRRIAVGAAGAVALLLLFFAGYRIVAAHRPPPPQPPVNTPSPSYINGFREYSEGFRVVAAGTLPADQNFMDLTWTPTQNAEITLFTRCAYDAPDTEVLIDIEILGSDFGPASCSSGSRDPTLPQVCLCVDHPVTAHLRFSGLKHGQDAAGHPVQTPVPLPVGTISVAFGESVSFDKYVFPPRPGELKPLPPPSCLEVRSDPADPLKPRQIPIPWHDVIRLYGYQQTPGHLNITLNGKKQTTFDSWDYELDEHTELVLTADVSSWTSPVTLTVTPEKVTGGWVVTIKYYPSSFSDVPLKIECAA